jgi:hypothetical protein
MQEKSEMDFVSPGICGQPAAAKQIAASCQLGACKYSKAQAIERSIRHANQFVYRYTPLKAIDGMPPALEYEPIRCKNQKCNAVLNPYW